jgi:hypothetical protein
MFDYNTDDILVLFEDELGSISLDTSNIGVTNHDLPKNPMLIHEVTSQDINP